MEWKVLKTEAAYQKAIKRTLEIFNAVEGTNEADELALLLILVKDYEDKHIKLPQLNPIEVIKLKMEEMGLKAKDLEPVIGSKGHISSILSGRREITLKMAQKLKDYFKLPEEVFLHSA
ncbi:MAG: helix-turn-helix domain-containing protein [Vicingaceae bacterium]|nr:helix-turn-helix domain-containing protein [Vicingaceae bacterium]